MGFFFFGVRGFFWVNNPSRKLGRRGHELRFPTGRAAIFHGRRLGLGFPWCQVSSATRIFVSAITPMPVVIFTDGRHSHRFVTRMLRHLGATSESIYFRSHLMARTDGRIDCYAFPAISRARFPVTWHSSTYWSAAGIGLRRNENVQSTNWLKWHILMMRVSFEF